MNEAGLTILVGLISAWGVLIVVIFGAAQIVAAFKSFADGYALNATRRREARKRFYRACTAAVRSIVNRLSKPAENAVAPDFSLWESPPPYRIALFHRCLRVGRKRNARLVVSDYPGRVSTGYVQTSNARIDLDMEVPTGASGDSELLKAALAAVS